MTFLTSFTVLDISLGIAGLYLLKRVLSQPAAAPLPPGPRPLPLIGNLLDFPKEREWDTYTRWGREYGDFTYLNLAGQPMLVLNSAQAADELLDRKGALYSDRPVLYLCSTLIGWDAGVPMGPYGDRHRQMRGLLSRCIGTRNALAQFEPIMELETRRFLRCVAAEPARLAHHARMLAGSIILHISHGYQVKEGQDPMVDLADKVMDEFSRCATAGAHLVDIFPWLNRLPDWAPGTGFRALVREMKQTQAEFKDIPHEFVQAQLAAGKAAPSFVGSNLNRDDLTPELDDLVRWAAVALYGGGADTTVSAVHSFFLAMTLFPEVQERAQAELDAVLEPDHLPTLSDRRRLPYIDALVSEVLRWGVVVPQGLPHRLREDDVHRGMLIPKGTIVVANIHGFMHDAAVYPDPDTFRPERFLGAAPQPDPRAHVFGFGRRVCPGAALADQELWLACASVLATLRITRATGADGAPVLPKAEWAGQLIVHPKDFVCDVKPRSRAAEEQLRLVPEAKAENAEECARRIAAARGQAVA